MQTLQQQLLIFALQTATLFFLTQQSLKNLYFFLIAIFKNNRVVYILLSLIYFPGTALHELAHFLTALILGLKVRSLNVFAQFEENKIHLGEVKFEKKDFLRSILVGVAPFFFALGFFYLLANFKLFPSGSFYQNLIFGYLVFAVSSTMFSSKEDLKDIIYVIPLFVFVAFVVYVFQIGLTVRSQNLLDASLDIVQTINQYLLVAILVNIGFIIVPRLAMIIFKR